MDDLISRQDAIDAIKGLEFCHYMEFGEYTREARLIRAEKAKDALQKLPSAQQWIPCSERLPEEEKDVLACTESGELLVAYVFNDWGNRWVWTTGALGSGSVDVVAWMPLPSPYEDKHED